MSIHTSYVRKPRCQAEILTDSIASTARNLNLASGVSRQGWGFLSTALRHRQ